MNQRELLERFVAENPELEEVEDLLAEFNIFDVLRLHQQEIRHSNFLAWILNPVENHSLGPYFLKRLLFCTSTIAKSLQIATVSPVDIDVWDMSDTIVLREWNRIDIMLLNEQQKFVCAIENKTFSTEHGHQLSRYRRLLEENYPNYLRHYILLTPEGTPPEEDEDEEKQYWVPLSYKTVCEQVEHVLESKRSTISEDVLMFMRHYTMALRRKILENSDLQQLAKRIYEKHKQALDLIYEYKPDTVSEVRELVEKEIRALPELKLDQCSRSYIRFYPDAWENIAELVGKGWTNSGRMLLFEFKNFDTSLKLYLILGPGSEATRRNIFNGVRTRSRDFKHAKKTLTPTWTTLFRKDFLKQHDYDDGDLDSRASRIQEGMQSFLKDDLPSIRDAVIEMFSRR